MDGVWVSVSGIGVPFWYYAATVRHQRRFGVKPPNSTSLVIVRFWFYIFYFVINGSNTCSNFQFYQIVIIIIFMTCMLHDRNFGCWCWFLLVEWWMCSVYFVGQRNLWALVNQIIQTNKAESPPPRSRSLGGGLSLYLLQHQIPVSLSTHSINKPS